MTARLTTKELSKRTWPDYERLFSQGNGWDHCGCTVYQGFRPPKHVRTWAEQRDWNLEIKRDLVERRRAHGILVYDGDEPIGWCQFGPKGELPIADARRTSPLFPDGDRTWKITCFVTLKAYQREGVARTSLHAALEAIRRKGGGRVQAHPYMRIPEAPPPDPRWRELRQIVRRDGPVTYYAGKAFLRHDVTIDGVGPVNAVYPRAMGMFHAGTVTMFEREGFKATGVLPSSPRVKSPWLQASRVVMQKTLRGRKGKR